MGDLVVINHVTLDGVMQAPGRPDEDDRDGFTAGGWAAERSDPQMGEAMSELMGAEFAWLFGRRTYDGLLSSWNEQGGPFKDSLNGLEKYIASRDSDLQLEWPNSTLVSGDVHAAISGVRSGQERNLVIMGSGELIAAVADLVDRWLLMIHPIVLGAGRRLFADGTPQVDLVLERSATTEAGVVLATYRRA